MEREQQFGQVAEIIRTARHNALRAVNTALIELYWNIDMYIQDRIDTTEWGVSVVKVYLP